MNSCNWGGHCVKSDSHCFTGFWDMAVATARQIDTQRLGSCTLKFARKQKRRNKHKLNRFLLMFFVAVVLTVSFFVYLVFYWQWNYSLHQNVLQKCINIFHWSYLSVQNTSSTLNSLYGILSTYTWCIWVYMHLILFVNVFVF